MGNEMTYTQNPEELLNKKIGMLKANSNLSEREIRELFRDFLNESPSGKMNKQQFHRYYKKLSDSDDKEGVFSDITFRVFDTNGDGSIDFNEFILAYASQANKDVDSQLDLIFSMLDESGDGRVNYNEMVKFMNVALQLKGNSRGNMRGTTVASEIFDTFGLNKNQSLSKNQFIDGCKRSNELNEVFRL